MSRYRLRKTALFLLYIVGVIAGDVKDQSLVGCEWFNESDSSGCTTAYSHKEPHDRCIFGSQGFKGQHYEPWQAIGMKLVESTKNEDSVPHLPSDLLFSQGLFAQQEHISKMITAYSSYFVSWPAQAISQAPYMSCALFLDQRKHKLRFPGWDTDPASATGTCADALDQPCIDAMLVKAKSLTNITSDGLDHCYHVMDAFTKIQSNRQLLPECATGRNADLDFGHIWIASIAYDDYTGGHLLSPYARNQGSCYPSFFPRHSSGMYYIQDYEFKSIYPPKCTWDQFVNRAFRITPILMFSWNIENGSFHEASSLTCLKPVDTNKSLESLIQWNASWHEPSGGPAAFSAPALWTLALGLSLSVIHVYCFS